jgi:hypothetical protein
MIGGKDQIHSQSPRGTSRDWRHHQPTTPAARNQGPSIETCAQ